MGYMGFGLQSWIYRQKPRRSFVLYKDLVVKEKGSCWKNTSNSIADIQKELDRKRHKEKIKAFVKLILTLFFIGLSILILIK